MMGQRLGGREVCVHGRLVFDVTGLLEEIAKEPDLFGPVEIDLSENLVAYCAMSGARPGNLPADESEKPVLAAMYADDRLLLLDGCVRIVTAWADGRRTLRAWIVAPEMLIGYATSLGGGLTH